MRSLSFQRAARELFDVYREGALDGSLKRGADPELKFENVHALPLQSLDAQITASAGIESPQRMWQTMVGQEWAAGDNQIRNGDLMVRLSDDAEYIVTAAALTEWSGGGNYYQLTLQEKYERA